MTTKQLKIRIIEKLEKTDNADLLEAVEQTIDHYSEEVYILSEDELRDVNRGLEQMRRGQVISDEESNRRIDEWLREE
jgi:predicted transcriptional regulator